MADTFDTVSTTLTADVANAGTFTVGYPAGRDAGYYTGGSSHAVITTPYGDLTVANGKAAFAFGASLVTITNNSGVTLKAGTRVTIQIDRLGRDGFNIPTVARAEQMAQAQMILVNLGAPATASANAIGLSQTLNAGVNGTVNGALAASGVATTPTPRNVVAAWTNTAVITVYGYDQFGKYMIESSGSGTSFTGKKAFARVTNFTVSANVTGLTVGTGVVLGLPVFLPGTGHAIRELQDGATPTAGTFAAGDLTKATATTGDVRGTWAPNAAPNGTRSYQVLLALGDASFRGVPQFVG